MKKIILALILSPIITYSQEYSNYYINTNSNVNVNSTVRHNVSGTVYEHKTINTIDYGALAIANVESEKNKLEQQKFEDQRQKQIAIEIAQDPLKSYDYGFQYTFNSNDKKLLDKDVRKQISSTTGFKSFKMLYVIPNSLLFVNAGQGRFQNTSADGITTEIMFYLPKVNSAKIEVDLEKMLENDTIKVGQENETIDENKITKKVFCHSKDLNRATVFGVKGYKSTLIWEDKFELGITDNFMSFKPIGESGYMNFIKVRFYGDKDEITFEQLEGRRYYFMRLIEKIVSTAMVFNEEIKQ